MLQESRGEQVSSPYAWPDPKPQGSTCPAPSLPLIALVLPGVPGLQGTIALQFLDQHFTASPYHIPDFPKGAAALEGATAILDRETQAGAMAERHRPDFGMLPMSGRSWAWLQTLLAHSH